MSDFKITLADVGRKVRNSLGQVGTISRHDSNSGKYPYVVDYGDVYALGSGKWYISERGELYPNSGKPTKYDAIAWADEQPEPTIEPAPRPKDLRDEFAMVALGGLTADPSLDYGYQSTQSYEDGVATLAYKIADAMMKAREAKP